MQKYEVVISEQALNDLERIDSYIFKLKGVNVNLPSDDILDDCRILEEYPFQKVFDCSDVDLNNMQFRKLIHNQYIVLYRVLNDVTVYIYHIVNSKQDYEGILKNCK